jgi:c-di-GMP-related signal transduction protein
MQKFIARQPILDRGENVVGYELLFRSADEPFSHIEDADAAASSVISDTMTLYGIHELTDGKRAFINCTRNALVNGRAALMPPDRIVIEVLETVEADSDVLTACRVLKSAGYVIALDDFRNEQHSPLVDLADIIKIDLLATPESETEETLRRYRERGIQFVAEKVETREQFQRSIEQGYSAFQGYFFAKPRIMASNDIPPAKLFYFSILRAVTAPEMDVRKVADNIKHDLGLSYKLLRFLNSAAFGFRNRIRSVRHAVALLGQAEMRKWISLVAIASLGEDKPPVLFETALTRAAFCESLARRLGAQSRQEDYFFLGLLSNIDAILGRPMKSALADLPIAEDVRQALLGTRNSLHDALQAVISYEKAEWEKLATYTSRVRLRDNIFPELFLSSVQWCRRIPFREVINAGSHAPQPAI